MAKTLTPDQAVERAMRAQENRIDAIRVLAHARQNLADTRTEAARRIAEVERETAATISASELEDVKQYNAAIAAGWSPDELRKIGYPEPEKKARTRRRAATRERVSPTDSDTQT